MEFSQPTFFHILKIDSFYKDEKRAHLPEISYLTISLDSRSCNFKRKQNISLPPSPCTGSWMTAIKGFDGAQIYASGFVAMQEGELPPQLRMPLSPGPACLRATLIKNEEAHVRKVPFSTAGQGAVYCNALQSSSPLLALPVQTGQHV